MTDSELSAQLKYLKEEIQRFESLLQLTNERILVKKKELRDLENANDEVFKVLMQKKKQHSVMSQALKYEQK